MVTAVVAFGCGSEGNPRDDGEQGSTGVRDEAGGDEESGETGSRDTDPTAGGDESSTGGEDDSGSDEGGNATTTGPVDPPFDCDDVGDGPFATQTFVQNIDAGGPLAFDGAGGMLVTTAGGHEDIVTYNLFEPDGSHTELLDAPAPWHTFVARGDGVWVPTFADGLREYSANALPLGTIAALEPAGSLARDPQGRSWLVDHARVGQIESSNFVATSGSSANALAVDPVAKYLYWTDPTDLHRVAFNGQGPVGEPESLGPLNVDNATGLTSDACGNLYVVRQHPLPSDLIRLSVDASGQVSQTSMLASTGPHAGAPLGRPVFGRGEGFGATSVYMAKLGDTSADIIVVDLGVPGADS